MARTAEGKFKIAKRAYEKATSELGLPASDIFFDPLALPLSTGIEEDRRNALETIKGIKRIKAELPGCFTILGVSNISFGLNPASRVVLNSVFLHDAVEAGLDAAIVNASKIEPLNRIGERELKVARDLIYDRREFDGEVCTYDPLTKFTTLFENVKTKSDKKASKGETVEERLKNHIIDGEKIGLEAELKTALETYSALDIILTNNGYRVINLGIKQTIDTILNAYEEHKADAIGLSGLLVKSTLIMKDNLEVMNERGVGVPVVLGGAALTRRYVEDDLKSIYKGTLFYARDAFAGLHTMDKLMSGDGHADEEQAKAAVAAASVYGDHPEEAEDLIGEEAKRGERKSARLRGVSKISGDTTHTVRSDVRMDVPIPQPPFFGSRVVLDVPIENVFDYVNETALFKGQWQFKQGRTSAEEYQALLASKVLPVYEELKQRCDREGLLVPRVVYGYFPAQSAGNELFVYDADARTE